MTFQGFGTEVKDRLDLPAYEERMGDEVKRDGISDDIPAERAAILSLERVLMNPLAIGAAQLFIHETEWGLPGGDVRAPADRKAVNAQLVINEGALLHGDGKRSDHLESERGRSDGLEIRCVGKEWKNLLRGER